MTTKALLVALLAACGVSSPDAAPNSPGQPEQIEPPNDDDPEVDEQYFCCEKTWSKDGEYHGQDCDLIGSGAAETCRLGGGKVLYCPGAWGDGENGVTSCSK